MPNARCGIPTSPNGPNQRIDNNCRRILRWRPDGGNSVPRPSVIVIVRGDDGLMS